VRFKPVKRIEGLAAAVFGALVTFSADLGRGLRLDQIVDVQLTGRWR